MSSAGKCVHSGQNLRLNNEDEERAQPFGSEECPIICEDMQETQVGASLLCRGEILEDGDATEIGARHVTLLVEVGLHS